MDQTLCFELDERIDWDPSLHVYIVYSLVASNTEYCLRRLQYYNCKILVRECVKFALETDQTGKDMS